MSIERPDRLQKKVMDVQILSPEVIQDTQLNSIESVHPDAIASTFSSDTIGMTCLLLSTFPILIQTPQLTRPVDLASSGLSSRILSTSDEWFAPASSLLSPTAPICRPGVYVHTGAWYDGWETRRHNPEPFDWVIVRLGPASGKVSGVEIDTAFFDGNHAPAVSVEGSFLPGGEEADKKVLERGFAGWEEVLPRVECGASRRHAWTVGESRKAYTHVRLCMYPDGGIARFRLYGTAVPVWPEDREEVVELSAAVMGGIAVSCSDQHFGVKDNLLLPGRGVDMGDGWETKRTRGAGHVDWVIVRLGARGVVESLVVDTAHFRGNFPQGVRVEGIDAGGETPAAGDARWVEVLGVQKLGPDSEHVYEKEGLRNVDGKAYTHMKMTIIPDGGVKRFRVLGRRA